MKITPENIEFHELIGLQARIVKASNPTLMGISGKIIDESKNTLKLITQDLIKIIPKKSSFFVFRLPDNTRIKIHGSLILGKPEDRIGRMKK